MIQYTTSDIFSQLKGIRLASLLHKTEQIIKYEKNNSNAVVNTALSDSVAVRHLVWYGILEFNAPLDTV